MVMTSLPEPRTSSTRSSCSVRTSRYSMYWLMAERARGALGRFSTTKRLVALCSRIARFSLSAVLILRSFLRSSCCRSAPPICTERAPAVGRRDAPPSISALDLRDGVCEATPSSASSSSDSSSSSSCGDSCAKKRSDDSVPPALPRPPGTTDCRGRPQRCAAATAAPTMSACR